MSASRPKPRRKASSFLMFLALLVPASLPAAVISFSASPPATNATDIYNWTGASFDADNVGGSGVNAVGGANTTAWNLEL